MGGEFRFGFRVAFHEVDMAGAMFFAHLFRHAHDAYEAWLGARGLSLADLAEGRPCRLPLVHAEADYLAPLKLGEDVSTSIGVEAIGDRSFTLAFECRGREGLLRARVRTVHVAVDPLTQRAVALPGPLRQALGAPG